MSMEIKEIVSGCVKLSSLAVGDWFIREERLGRAGYPCGVHIHVSWIDSDGNYDGSLHCGCEVIPVDVVIKWKRIPPKETGQ